MKNVIFKKKELFLPLLENLGYFLFQHLVTLSKTNVIPDEPLD